MSLTGKQKSALKSRGQRMSDDIHLGNDGLSDGFVAHLNALLLRKELVKLRFTELEGDARKEMASDLCEAVGAECVAVVGRTVLLYKANPELPAKKRALAGDAG